MKDLTDKCNLIKITNILQNNIHTENEIEYVITILTTYYKKYKKCLNYAFTYDEIDKIEELLMSSNTYGGGEEWIDNFVKDSDIFTKKIIYIMSTIQNILTYIIQDLFSIKNIDSDDYDSIFKCRSEYFREIYVLSENMILASSIIEKRINSHKRCKKTGEKSNLSTYIHNEIKNILIKISKSDNKSEDKSTVCLSDQIWNILAKYTSSNQLIINDDVYIYVDGDKIYQDIKKKENSITRKTFKNYITKVKKELEEQKII